MIDPNKANAQTNKGLALQKLGRKQEALNCYKQAIEINPQAINARQNLGALYNNLHEFEIALEVLDEVVKMDPTNAEVHNNKGLAFKHLGRNDEALDSYKQAIEVNPKVVNARINLAALLLNLNKLDEALEVLDQAIQLIPNNANVYNQKGITLRIKTDFKASLECFEKAVKLDDRYLFGFANKSQVEDMMGLIPQSQANLKKASTLLKDTTATKNLYNDYIKYIQGCVDRIQTLQLKFHDQAEKFGVHLQIENVPTHLVKFQDEYIELKKEKDEIIGTEFKKIQDSESMQSPPEKFTTILDDAYEQMMHKLLLFSEAMIQLQKDQEADFKKQVADNKDKVAQARLLQEAKDKLDRENREKQAQEERDKIARDKIAQDEIERLEREKKALNDKELLDLQKQLADNKKIMDLQKQLLDIKERIDVNKQAADEKERQDRLRQEQAERDRLALQKQIQDNKDLMEQQRIKDQNERDRLAQEKAAQDERDQQDRDRDRDRLKKEKDDKDRNDQMEKAQFEKDRLNNERLDKQQKDLDERNRLERLRKAQEEGDRIARLQASKEEKDRLDREKQVKDEHDRLQLAWAEQEGIDRKRREADERARADEEDRINRQRNLQMSVPEQKQSRTKIQSKTLIDDGKERLKQVIEIKEGWDRYLQLNPELYYYAKAFYWTLINYFDAHRVDNRGDKLKMDLETYVNNQPVKEGTKILSYGVKYASNLPLLRGCIEEMFLAVGAVYQKFKTRKDYDCIKAINKIIRNNQDPEAINMEGLSRTIAQAALLIVDRRYSAEEKQAIRSAERIQLKQDKPKQPPPVREERDFEKQMKYCMRKVEGILAIARKENIELYKTPGGQEALKDVFLLIIYITSVPDKIVKFTLTQKFYIIIADAVFMKKFTGIINEIPVEEIEIEDKRIQANQDAETTECCQVM